MNSIFIKQAEILAIPAVEISDSDRLAPNPFVSVIVVTYNHEAYIAQNIEGILAQRSEFPFELIIGEDKSTDGTLEICLSYQKKYPDIIRLITWQENLGIGPNYLRCLGRARGEYIAFCEGDDYWIDPDKLTKQVALMEKYPDTSLCGARTRVLMEIPGREPVTELIGPEQGGTTYSLKDVLSGYLFHTSSFLLRKSTLQLTQHARSMVYPDGYLQCLSALKGSLRSIPDVVSVYRHHPKGVCIGGSINQHLDRCEAICRDLLDFVDGYNAYLVKCAWDVVQYRRCHHFVNQGRITEARTMARGLLGRLVRHDPKRALMLFFHVFLPKPYAIVKRWAVDAGHTKRIRRVIF